VRGVEEEGEGEEGLTLRGLLMLLQPQLQLLLQPQLQELQGAVCWGVGCLEGHPGSSSSSSRVALMAAAAAAAAAAAGLTACC